MNKDLLMIFVKIPELGKVKTRLAADIGDEQALYIYKKLLAYTRYITRDLSCDKKVYYTPSIQYDDIWEEKIYQKALQSPGELGERMKNAFEENFASGYQKICIIGSDCYQLTPTLLEEAFKQLTGKDMVIGPSEDGGYYLLGMKHPHKELFTNKTWSTPTVFKDTLQDIQSKNLSYFLLPQLNDVDEEKDLITMDQYIPEHIAID